ncbi:hypothetical protein ABZ490_40965 [Streptomyces sp. NPDC005811]|uniref:hypothetical protein n=1 Tax=Streptomyces sp. NPDC005811 TaxID=3154565 RepID=UPI0033C13024
MTRNSAGFLRRRHRSRRPPRSRLAALLLAIALLPLAPTTAHAADPLPAIPDETSWGTRP